METASFRSYRPISSLVPRPLPMQLFVAYCMEKVIFPYRHPCEQMQARAHEVESRRRILQGDGGQLLWHRGTH